VLVAVLPLVLTSVLAEALMVALGMGVKVATLPVIALGVGIGVDYALYILSVTLVQLREGRSLAEAYDSALQFTGKVVMLTGVTLAVGVVTWVASPIKFQADMGLLLAFMFLWNMLDRRPGALVLRAGAGADACCECGSCCCPHRVMEMRDRPARHRVRPAAGLRRHLRRLSPHLRRPHARRRHARARPGRRRGHLAAGLGARGWPDRWCRGGFGGRG
jgi:hypothetical protein